MHHVCGLSSSNLTDLSSFSIARLQLNNNSGAKEDLLKYIEQLPNAADKKNIEDTMRQF